MKASRPAGSSSIRFAVDELPPHLLAAGLGLQVVVLIIAALPHADTWLVKTGSDLGRSNGLQVLKRWGNLSAVTIEALE